MLAALSQRTERDRARPARHLRRATATSGCSPRRRRASTSCPAVGSSSASVPVGTSGVPGLRLRFPCGRERLRLLDETLQVIPRLWSEETVDFDGAARAARRRVLRPEAAAAASPADLGRRRRRAGDAAHRRRATPTRPTGRSASTPSSASRRCSRGTATTIGRDFDAIVRTHGPTAGSSTPRPTSPVARRARTADTSGARPTTTSTCATTSSAPSTRSPRRRRPTSTPAVGVRPLVPRLPVHGEPRGVGHSRRSEPAHVSSFAVLVRADGGGASGARSACRTRGRGPPPPAATSGTIPTWYHTVANHLGGGDGFVVDGKPVIAGGFPLTPWRDPRRPVTFRRRTRPRSRWDRCSGCGPSSSTRCGLRCSASRPSC